MNIKIFAKESIASSTRLTLDVLPHIHLLSNLRDLPLVVFYWY